MMSKLEVAMAVFLLTLRHWTIFLLHLSMSSNSSTVLQGKSICPPEALTNGTGAANPTNFDVFTPNKLDNKYYLGLKSQKGLLVSDQTLMSHPITAKLVNYNARYGSIWARKFAAAMVHMGTLDVLTGSIAAVVDLLVVRALLDSFKEECEYLISLAKPHIQKSSVVDSSTGKSMDSRVRTSSGTFLARGRDKVIRDIEKRIADFTFIPAEGPQSLKRVGALPKREDSSRILKKGKGSDTCHKCGKLGHYIKDCPMHKIEYKEYAKQDDGNENEKDRVPVRFSKKAEIDKVVNQVLTACWVTSQVIQNKENKLP
ncbi:hypothetical protein T459_29546 [Capsicum annuum]|uniref:Peroxidase n=1 Tax=Capsicum annuum TaxID=4072 RepID=A0A2G2Y6C5_CAPAN|nr:hypothetical protein T459_29546 [Capsicum annuum]